MAFPLPSLGAMNQGLFNQRFFNNFLPMPATEAFSLGQRVVDFELPEVSQGQPVKLASYWGKQPVVLAFTRIFTDKHYCPLCFPHIQALNDAYEQFQEHGAELLMITSTDQLQSQRVKADLGLKMPLLSDPSCQAFRTYQTGQALGAPLPAQFVVDRHGRLRFRHLFSFLSNNASATTLLEIIRTL
jgi:peroxiredoxin